jgi:photosystem II stability/assembly factor-like uncharacterized protein
MKTALLAALAVVVVFVLPSAAGATIFAGNTGWKWTSPAPTGNQLTLIDSSGGWLWAAGSAGTLAYSHSGDNVWSGVRTGVLDDIRQIDVVSENTVVFAGRCALRRIDLNVVGIQRLPWTSNDDNCESEIARVSFPSVLSGFLLLQNNSVYATFDGGVSWNKRGVLPAAAGGDVGAISDMHFNAQGEGVVAAGNRILRTQDGGANWTPVTASNLAGSGFKFSFVADHLGLAVGDHADLLVTYDGGASWTAIAGDGALRNRSFSSVTCNQDFSVCLALPADGGDALRSTDRGEHWSSTGGHWTSAAYRAGSWYAVGADGISVGSADASSWSLITKRLPSGYTGLHSVWPGKYAAYGAQGAVALYGGGGWTSQPLPAPAARVQDAILITNSALALDAKGQVFRARKRPADWNLNNWKRVARVKPAPRALHTWTNNRTLLVGPRGVRVSARWGKSSKPVSGVVRKLSLSEVDATAKTVWAWGARALAFSTNRGKTWRRVRLPGGVTKIKNFDMATDSTGFLLDTKNELYRTANRGRRWMRVETTGANTATSMAFGSQKYGYIADANGRILATNDAGKTWARQYPYFDASESAAPLLVAAGSGANAMALRSGTDSIFGTDTAGRMRSSSALTIKPSSTKVIKGDVIPVTGRLSPALGGERIAVLARIVGAPAGTPWVTQNATVAPDGTFTTRWKITAPTRFIARWSGDATHDGDGAPAKIVNVRR